MQDTVPQVAASFRWQAAENYEVMSQLAADFIAAEVLKQPSLLLAASAGYSPTRTYALLAAKKRRETNLFARLRVVKLDEWGGLSADDPHSCEAYLRRHLLGPLDVSEERYCSFRGDAPDPEAECRRVADFLDEQGPIHLCLLGLGRNGHLGLNEPAEHLNPSPHVAILSK